VATLRVLHDAGASDALARLLTGPRWRIGPRDLVALGRRARALVRGEDDRPPPPAERGPAGRDPREHDPAEHETAEHETAEHETAEHETAEHETAEHETAEHETAGHDPADALAEAVTDLTAETGSLVEALDDLGDPRA
jgi:DNA helicase II / ATP-dependent DNA helicase PcrA